MPLVLERSEVLDVYARAAAERWVVPTFCTENLTTTEAVLSAAVERARELRIPSVPVTIAMTVQYRNRPQATLYTHTRRWDLGLKLFLADLRELTAPESPFAKLDVMVHLDHVQWDADAPLLEWNLSQFSSIMYDASTLPFDENIRRTAEFVARYGRTIVVEGACDEITDASGREKGELTTPEAAARYYSGTKVDFLVANIGTEHRASSQDVKYRSDLAREVSQRVGPRLVVHGASSVAPAELANLFSDGVVKVNIWTALERDSSPALLADLAADAAKVAGPDAALAMQNEGLIGPKADTTSKASLSHFTTTHRQEIVFSRMSAIALEFLRLWYV